MSAAATEPAISGWPTTPLKAEVTLKNGKAYNAKDWKKEGYPIIRIQNLKNPLAEFNYFQGDPETEVPIRSGDLVFSWSGSKGTSFGPHIWRGQLGVLNQHIFKVVMNPDSQLGQDFLYYALRFLTVAIEDKAYGLGALVHVRKGDLEATPIPLPPLPEQKQIAHILATVQRAIEAQERIIQITTELKKALMHKLFTEGLRNEPQKQTEIGPVPESWEVVELVNIARIERGKFSHRPRNEPRFYGGEYPFVQTGDVSNCDGYVRSYTQTLNEDGLAISKMFPAGTILITIAANIGFTGILKFDSACPDSLIGITPNENVHTEFLNYYLITQQSEMDRLAPKGTQKNINIQFLKPWPVPLPSVEEQTGIEEALSATDRKIRLAIQKRNQLQDLFRTLLHELMTAKIRVHDLKLSNQASA